MAAAVLVFGACGSSKSNSNTTPTTAASTGTTAQTSTGPAKAGDVGITATTIRIGVVADVDTAVLPGLFMKNVNVMKAWAANINKNGGLAGRKVVLDVYDSKLDPNATRSAVITACSTDFAMVGTAALALSDLSDIDTCKNSSGQAVGIPNVSGIAFGTLAECDPDTYIAGGSDPTLCATLKDTPQSYTVQAGDDRWLAKQTPGLHGIWLYDTSTPASRAAEIPIYTADSAAGIKKDGEGFYGANGEETQSSYTPIIQVLKQNSSSFLQDGSTPPGLVLVRREAVLQGVTSVKDWVCSAGCYGPTYPALGGATVNGTYNTLVAIPFQTDYASYPALAAVVSGIGGVNNLDSNSLASFVAAELFQDAVDKTVANGGTLTRSSLFNTLKTQETAFNAGGVIGTTDVSAHALSPCFAMAQIINGAWQQIYPTKAGTFDCTPSNLVIEKLNMNA